LGRVLGAAAAVACAQAVVLRARLRLARRPGSVPLGALSGAVTGAALAAGPVALLPELGAHPLIAIAIALYVGAAVGAFLSYFRRDDARIEAEARARGRDVDYGRDACWLGPVAYGALAFLCVVPPRGGGHCLGAA